MTLRAGAIVVVVLLLRIYRRWISPLKPPTCRFLPTCSEYAIEAFQVHGFWKGMWLTLRRLARCHPWGGHGYDPVPRKCPGISGNFSSGQDPG